MLIRYPFCLMLISLLPIFAAPAPAPAAPSEQSAEALIREGIKLHDAGKYKEAIEKYDAALKAEPQSCVAAYEKVFSLYASKDGEGTIKTAEAALKGPCAGHKDMRMLLASAYDDRGENPRAIELLKGLIKEAPNNPYMYFNLAVSYHRAGRNKEAEESLQTALKIDPRHVSSHYALGKVLFGTGRRGKGVLCFYMALLLDPGGRRSAEIYQIIDKYYADLISEKNGKEITVNVSSAGDIEDAGFSDINLGMAAALAKTKKLEKDAAFEEMTLTYLKVLSEVRQKEKGFYWNQYVDFFTALKAAQHETTFVKLLQVTASAKAREWLEANREKMLLLRDWMNARFEKK